MTTLWLKIETVLHDGLPFRPVRPGALALFAGLPVYDEVGDLVGDGVAQEIVTVLHQELPIDAQAGCAIAIDSGLGSASAAQRQVDRCFRKVETVIVAGVLFCLPDGCFCLLQNICIGLFL
jgi:hypothetical protein